ncbi:exonuclease SbcCD subunit D C-terminal domain-containing protein [Parasutterella secunda]|uniref:exonuclease SbcCD subunit D C-terminal domain-containing protein n=1 Tax=Parasutterella secunda TaxID=626947 RepID=UPI0021AC76D9|nr:exonuclease SbcCD subunit D C-terminal domain-containing protein [Parasutterella secunda]MCR8920688.1 exonuclease SbcCD subunit D C-terminal domain-containing protein [Parasutterella secunda]
MRILHTSDWHIGSALYGRKRYDESEQFLHWLVETIKNCSIEALLVAGDIFDTSTPSNTAQELYYRFLNEVSRTTCRHVIVTGGNHDSPSFLDAPKALLKAFNVYVVGSAAEREEDEVLVLKDADNNSEAIVCAVPFLRDRDVRQSSEGESYRDKENRLVEGIISHYQTVYEEACKERNELGKSLPIIGMGHLFIAGSSIYKRSGETNGERDLYVGSLGQVPADRLPPFDYFALGHLHIPQNVAGCKNIRYSGSPMAMNFDEIHQQKSVVIVDIHDQHVHIRTVPVPAFRHFEQIKGDWDSIEASLRRLKEESFAGWVEVIYEGQEVIGNLRERVYKLVENTSIEVLKIQNAMLFNAVMKQYEKEVELQDLNPADVFDQCLTDYGLPDDQKVVLKGLFSEVCRQISEADNQKE